MSLGVLNNISAMYAENNLNQTQSSLQNTLTQLSSGSRINSGSDDAAGLSLADGLTASSAALSQSASNASEGVDFLQVADGALSQVTSLLNRAVTLATEASNGTLNSAQEAATNAEYSSIMTEISTINSNTEYNGLNVFSKAANIFTSDGSVSQTYANAALGSTGSDALKLGTTVYASGTVAATGAAGSVVGTTDAYGNAIASGDVLATVADPSGKSITLDLTAMMGAAAATAVQTAGNLSDTNAIAITGDTAVAGAVQAATATGTAGTATTEEIAANGSTDQYGAAVKTSDFVFTNVGVTPTVVVDAGTTDPGTAGSDGVYVGTSLDSTAQAEIALTAITAAISQVAATRGTEGAEVNTLNAVENVQSTQSTNTTSAENDVMATDYASATSNLSKYEILEQTGISALAQANSTEQLVTKLLQ
ncbi:MAG TPA: flagellin [Acidobacteriaceae bacterium]|nr:flagellin [Acidobacteriaceae bacterium]